MAADVNPQVGSTLTFSLFSRNEQFQMIESRTRRSRNNLNDLSTFNNLQQAYFDIALAHADIIASRSIDAR